MNVLIKNVIFFRKVFKGSVIENNKPCVVAIKKIKKSNENQGVSKYLFIIKSH